MNQTILLLHIKDIIFEIISRGISYNQKEYY